MKKKMVPENYLNGTQFCFEEFSNLYSAEASAVFRRKCLG